MDIFPFQRVWHCQLNNCPTIDFARLQENNRTCVIHRMLFLCMSGSCWLTERSRPAHQELETLSSFVAGSEAASARTSTTRQLQKLSSFQGGTACERTNRQELSSRNTALKETKTAICHGLAFSLPSRASPAYGLPRMCQYESLHVRPAVWISIMSLALLKKPLTTQKDIGKSQRNPRSAGAQRLWLVAVRTLEVNHGRCVVMGAHRHRRCRPYQASSETVAMVSAVTKNLTDPQFTQSNVLMTESDAARSSSGKKAATKLSVPTGWSLCEKKTPWFRSEFHGPPSMACRGARYKPAKITWARHAQVPHPRQSRVSDILGGFQTATTEQRPARSAEIWRSEGRGASYEKPKQRGWRN